FRRRTRPARSRARRGLRLVHLLGQLVTGLGEQLHLLLDHIAVVGLQGIAKLADAALDVAADVGADLLAILLERFLRRVGEALALVLEIDDLAAFLVVGRMGLGVALHLLDLFLGESAGIGDRDLVLL